MKSNIIRRTWMLAPLWLVLFASSILRPSKALLSPIHPKRTVAKSFTKYWSLPEDQDDSQLKGPQDSGDDIVENQIGDGIENQIGSKIQRSTDKDETILLGSLLQNTDLLEVRLDATLCAIFVLARFLLYDVTLPPKEVPGMEIVDVVAVLDTFSSAGALAILWSIAGIGVGLFETSSEKNSSDLSLLTQLFGTTAISVPLWIFLEKICHWPISAGLEGKPLLEAMFLASLGVLGTMLIGRTISRFLP